MTLWNLPNLFLMISLFLSFSAWSAQLSDDFSLVLNKDSGDLVWNLNNASLHPPLKIKDYVNNAGTATLSENFIVGTGQHGVFNANTYSSFSEGGDVSGNIIRLNTSTYYPLQVTSFQLNSGWTLQPVGDNPLVIYSQGDVVIEGSIDCSGPNGEAFKSIDTKSSGGTGRCGGGSGGAGAWKDAGVDQLAANGTFLGVTVTAGKPSAGKAASTDGKGSGGGGGGSYAANAAASVSEPGTSVATGTGGLKGDVEPDHNFQFLGGGAGGGGGDMNITTSLSGAGGGAGGGVVVIHAFGDIKIYPTGGINANGGNGGGNAAQNSGAGGAGGGGSIKLFALGEVYSSGPVRAYGGTGGSNNSGINGGRGGSGRTWLAGKSGYSQALPSYALNAEKPDTLLAHVGYGKFQTGTFTMSSKTLDSMSTRPSVTSATLTTSLSAGASSLLELSSGEVTDFTPTTWINASSITEPQARYFRFRASLTNTDEAAGAYVNSMQINYTPYLQQEFEFNQGGCGRVAVISPSNNDDSQGPPWFYILSLFVIFSLPIMLALKLKSQSVHNL